MSTQPEPTVTTRNDEPIYCGLCLYGSDVGVPGYDDKGPAYTNPACPDHSPETAKEHPAP
ncbi:hypothetical protein [Streptomyces sp. NPDC005969]|uniref:hypothetical protein n=1 Tax=Streptomyces sp. NPDC005969 TaxID=3156722 RepID=UPI003411AE00